MEIILIENLHLEARGIWDSIGFLILALWLWREKKNLNKKRNDKRNSLSLKDKFFLKFFLFLIKRG